MKTLARVMSIFEQDNEAEAFHVWQILGPIFIIATFALADNSALLISGGLLGLYCAARSKKNQALLSVVAFSLIQQLLLDDHHLWFLGLEFSLGCAVFITALSFESDAQFVGSLVTQADAHAASLQNIEEELSKERESAQAQQITLQERIDQLQKELEEVQAEESTLCVLNEVLRKTAVRNAEEKVVLEEKSLNQQRRVAALQADLIKVEKELERLSHPESLAEQNRHLINELNAARYQKEQTQLINETLVRLHAKESMKSKETAGLQQMLDQVMKEKDELRTSLEKMETIWTEKRAIEDRLNAANEEMERLKAVAESKEEAARKEVEWIKASTERAPVLAQLRRQFEEKNKILHETRVALFKTDSELQTIRLEKEQLMLQVGVIPKEVLRDLERLESETSLLKEENGQLEEIVSTLSLKKN